MSPRAAHCAAVVVAAPPTLTPPLPSSSARPAGRGSFAPLGAAAPTLPGASQVGPKWAGRCSPILPSRRLAFPPPPGCSAHVLPSCHTAAWKHGLLLHACYTACLRESALTASTKSRWRLTYFHAQRNRVIASSAARAPPPVDNSLPEYRVDIQVLERLIGVSGHCLLSCWVHAGRALHPS